VFVLDDRHDELHLGSPRSGCGRFALSTACLSRGPTVRSIREASATGNGRRDALLMARGGLVGWDAGDVLEDERTAAEDPVDLCGVGEGAGQDLSRRAVGHDLPVTQEQHAVGADSRQLYIVGGHPDAGTDTSKASQQRDPPSPRVGSSSRRTAGALASTAARATRWRSPVLRSRGLRAARWATPAISSAGPTSPGSPSARRVKRTSAATVSLNSMALGFWGR